MTQRVISPMERERAVVTGLLLLQLLLWLGFVVHRAPRFPGSLSGTALGIAAAVLMVLPSLAYVAVRRLPGLRARVSDVLPLRRLLAWHVYGGVLGAILAILHTGHRFESTLGLALTGVMLGTVFSGYVGRHFIASVSGDMRDKQILLDQLMNDYNRMVNDLAADPQRRAAGSPAMSRWARLRRRVGVGDHRADPTTEAFTHRAMELAESIADVEYAITAHDLLRRRCRAWLAVHIVTSVAFYALLGLHVWSSIYFGFRWLV